VHSLVGIALARVGRHVDIQPTDRDSRSTISAGSAEVVFGVTLIFAANAPDLDFIPGILSGQPFRFHHGPSHSLGAALVIALVAAPFLARRSAFRSVHRFGLLVGFAVATHLILDMLSSDGAFVLGVPLFWPILDRPLVLPFAVFVGLRREMDVGNFFQSLLLRHNAYSVAEELAVATVFWLVWRAVSGHWRQTMVRAAQSEMAPDDLAIR